MAVINDVAYSFSMIKLTSAALGITDDSSILQGVSAIKWSKSREVKNNYGLGGNVVSRGFGNKVCTGSITMDYNTQQLLKKLGKGSLMDLGEFDLVLSFANAFAGSDWTAETVTLKGCILTEEGIDAKNDDTDITKEFNLNPKKIVTDGESSDSDSSL